MSVIASALKHMLAAGMPADAIVAAVAEMEAQMQAGAPDPVAEKRRRYDRERKRNAKLSGGIPVESADSVESAESGPFLDKEIPPRPPKEINPIPVRDTHPRDADLIAVPVAVKLAVVIATCRAIGKIKPPFSLPTHIPEDPWNDFVAMRRGMRKPMNDRAKELAVIRLDKLAADGWPPGDVLNNSTMNSYQGLVPPKDRNYGTNRQNRPASDEPRDPMVRAVLAREAERSGAEPYAPF